MPLSNGLIHAWTGAVSGGILPDLVGSLNLTPTTPTIPVVGFDNTVQVTARDGTANGAIKGLHKKVTDAKDAFAYARTIPDIEFSVGTPKSIAFVFKPYDDGGGNQDDHYLVSDLRFEWSGPISFQGAWGIRWNYVTGTTQYTISLDIVHDTGLMTTITSMAGQFPFDQPFLGVWHTVAVTYDGTTFSLFVDCVGGGTTNQAPTPYAPSHDNHIAIGGVWITNPTTGPGQGASAALYQLGIWNRVLSADEMGLICGGTNPISICSVWNVYAKGFVSGENLCAGIYGLPTRIVACGPIKDCQIRTFDESLVDPNGMAAGNPCIIRLERDSTDAENTDTNPQSFYALELSWDEAT